MGDQVQPALRAAIEALAAKPYVRDLFGIRLDDVAMGSVILSIDHRPELGHRPGWFQGAITTAIGELAASWSTITMAPAGSSMITIEQSIRFVNPARGDRLVAVGRTIASGRSISVGAADVFAVADGMRMLCAILTLTNKCRQAR